MRVLAIKEVEFVRLNLQEKGIANEDLRLNLLDHICCVIEEEWTDEQETFDEIYARTLPRFFKKELREIEEETQLLIRFKNYYTMKKVMINTGIVAAFLFIIGSLFKFMHWPGAAMALVIAIFLFCFIFLPLLFLFKFKEEKIVQKKLAIGVATVFGILISMAIIFKVMHWPGANMMWSISLAILFFLFLPLHYFTGIRNEETKSNTIVSSILILAACGLLFTATNLRPSKRMEGSILENNHHVNRTLKILESSFIKDSSTNEIIALCEQTTEQVKNIKSFLMISMLNQENPTETDLVRVYGNDLGRPTALLFTEEGAPLNDLNKLKFSLIQLKRNLENIESPLANIFELKERRLHNNPENPKVSWENEQFYQIPTVICMSNLNQIMLDVNIVRLQISISVK